MVPGIDLKLARVANRVTQTELARELGVSPGRVSHIEAAGFVPLRTAERYRAALQRVLERQAAGARARAARVCPDVEHRQLGHGEDA